MDNGVYKFQVSEDVVNNIDFDLASYVKNKIAESMEDYCEKRLNKKQSFSYGAFDNVQKTMDDLKTIRAHIERVVTHIAREHNATDDVVWKQMMLASTSHFMKLKSQDQ